MKAYEEIEDKIDIRFAETASSYVINDNVKKFYGETHEKLYINLFNSLNYIMLRNFEGALVESKRAYRTNQVYGLDSSLLNFVYALSSDILGEYNSANIEYKKLYNKGIKSDFLIKRLFLNASYLGDFEYVTELKEKYDEVLNDISSDEKYLIIFLLTGRSPIKEETFIIVDNIKFSVPSYKRFNNQIKTVRIKYSFDNEHYGIKNSVLLDDINQISENVLSRRMKNIIIKESIRTYLKASFFRGTDKQTSENEESGFGFKDLLKTVMMLSQFADLRCWYSLPGYVSVVPIIISEKNIDNMDIIIETYNEKNDRIKIDKYENIDLTYKYNFLKLIY